VTPAERPPIRLDANESPWPLPPPARVRLAEVLAEAPLHRYPDSAAREVKRLLAARLSAAPDELVLGVGSDEVLGMLMAIFGKPRSDASRASVVLPVPTFVMVSLAARVHGLDPIEVPLLHPTWALDREGMLDAIRTHRPNLVYVATPNNPTGNVVGDDDLEALIRAAPDALVVIDDAYGAFAGITHEHLCTKHANVAVVGTLSKIGFAGLRLGWARLHPLLAAEVEKARLPYNLGTYAQLAAATVLGEMPEVIDDAVARIVAERARLGAKLAEIERVRVHPSQANFFLVEVPDAAAVQAELATRGIAVRSFTSSARLVNCLRITVGTEVENDALVAALREVV
jgi:histidinol-phosphate aminotransferase